VGIGGLFRTFAGKILALPNRSVAKKVAVEPQGHCQVSALTGATCIAAIFALARIITRFDQMIKGKAKLLNSTVRSTAAMIVSRRLQMLEACCIDVAGVKELIVGRSTGRKLFCWQQFDRVMKF